MCRTSIGADAHLRVVGRKDDGFKVSDQKIIVGLNAQAFMFTGTDENFAVVGFRDEMFFGHVPVLFVVSKGLPLDHGSI